MNANRPRRTVNHRSFYSLRQAAWTLGISADDLAAAIRRSTIRAERRRSALVVTVAELARHLPADTDTPAPRSGHMAADAAWLGSTLDSLARLRHVPTSVLAETVIRDCDCLWPDHDDHAPDGDSDAVVAALACAGCRAQNACLELELRLGGQDTVGVWGGLCEQDRPDDPAEGWSR